MEKVIDKEKHYFVLMHPIENVFGLIFYTSSNTREKFVECEIVEDRYKVSDGYKVTLKSIEPGYGWEHFYQEDFLSLLEKGIIVEKTSAGQHVEEIFWREHLCGDAYLEHSAYVVSDN